MYSTYTCATTYRVWKIPLISVDALQEAACYFLWCWSWFLVPSSLSMMEIRSSTPFSSIRESQQGEDHGSCLLTQKAIVGREQLVCLIKCPLPPQRIYSFIWEPLSLCLVLFRVYNPKAGGGWQGQEIGWLWADARRSCNRSLFLPHPGNISGWMQIHRNSASQ